MANIHKLNPHDINNRDKNMNITIDEASRKLRLLLDEAVRRNLTDGILLSGGLDTSVLAKVASEYVSLKAFTVAFKNTPAPDVEYAKSIAAHLGLKHTTHYFDENELYHAISAVIKTMKSFDPHVIRNSAPLFIGLTLAGEEGSNNVMTGEGCDELFAGYPYLYELEREQLRLELHKLWKIGIFPEIDLAKSLGMQVKLPYLDPKLVSFAMDLDPDLKVREEKGQKWGKWIVRKAFEDTLPKRIVWRKKMGAEFGSGTASLTSILNSRISDMEFERKKKKYLDDDGVVIRAKEQLFYYEIFKSEVGTPPLIEQEGKTCPYCNSSVSIEATYCPTCGAYPL